MSSISGNNVRQLSVFVLGHDISAIEEKKLYLVGAPFPSSDVESSVSSFWVRVVDISTKSD